MIVSLNFKIKATVLLFVFFYGNTIVAQQRKPIDAKAPKETKALYANLWKLSKNHTLFGHQHDTQYGHGWFGDANRSDVKSVVGSYPAVIGVDFSDFSGKSAQISERAKADVRQNVIDTYNRGGVTTAAWHFNNPLSKGGFYWVDSLSKASVHDLIPGGNANNQYKEILKGIGDWANSVRGADGKLVPMIFRPFHENDGDWFWWGRKHTEQKDFVALWRFTVAYLRDSLGVHNFIYAFSPDARFKTEEAYLERYPGDAYVDMLGMDNYGDMGRDRYDLPTAAKKLKIISDYAIAHGKLAAFTETGLETIPNPTWWTGTLLKTMKMYPMRLCYVLVWRNDRSSPTHFYAPFPGQKSVPDFMNFYNDPYTLFEKDLNHIYKKEKFLGIF